MKVKKGDTIQMLAGKDRGKNGKIIEVQPVTARVVVEGLNLLTKHQKAKKQGEKGQKIQIPRAVTVSNVALICPKCNKPTRVGYSVSGDKKLRSCKQCQATF